MQSTPPVGRPARPAPSEAPTIAAALTEGREAFLTATCQYLARLLDDGVPSREVAPIMRRLSDLQAELERITPDPESDAERLARQRRERLAAEAAQGAEL